LALIARYQKTRRANPTAGVVFTLASSRLIGANVGKRRPK